MIKFKELHNHLKGMFALDWMDYHGLPHWARVYANAKLLAIEERKLNPQVVIYEDVLKLFAFLHDHQRWNDYSDPLHGFRAAQAAHELRKKKYFILTDLEMEILCFAMTYHSDGMTVASPTTMICWDADRLDLGRVGKKPDPQYLCTKTARENAEFLEAAYKRSIS